MHASKPRNRIVVFRLSQDEFMYLKSACETKGGRSISEFTRSELFNRLQAAPTKRLIDTRLSAIERRIEEMTTAMRRMSQLLETEPNTNKKPAMASGIDGLEVSNA